MSDPMETPMTEALTAPMTAVLSEPVMTAALTEPAMTAAMAEPTVAHVVAMVDPLATAQQQVLAAPHPVLVAESSAGMAPVGVSGPIVMPGEPLTQHHDVVAAALGAAVGQPLGPATGPLENGELVAVGDDEDDEGEIGEDGERQPKKARVEYNAANNPYRGVYLCNGKWSAILRWNYKQLYLGKFNNSEEAARFYDRALLRLKGQPEHLNFGLEHYANDAFLEAHQHETDEDFIKAIKDSARDAMNSTTEYKKRHPQYIGVYKSGTRWQPRTRLNGKIVLLGSFSSADEAARTYDRAMVRFKKARDSSKLNFRIEDYEHDPLLQAHKDTADDDFVKALGDHAKALSPSGERDYKKRHPQYKGVYKSGQRWQPRLRYKSKIMLLNSFTNPEEAAHFYDRAAIKLKNVTDNLNFPLSLYAEDEFMARYRDCSDDDFIHAIKDYTRTNDPAAPRSGGGKRKAPEEAGMGQVGLLAAAQGLVAEVAAAAGVGGPDPNAAGAMADLEDEALYAEIKAKFAAEPTIATQQECANAVSSLTRLVADPAVGSTLVPLLYGLLARYDAAGPAGASLYCNAYRDLKHTFDACANRANFLAMFKSWLEGRYSHMVQVEQLAAAGVQAHHTA